MHKYFIDIIRNKNELQEVEKCNKIKLLLDNGVNPNFEIKNDICNIIPIFECVLCKDFELLEILLSYNRENRADPNFFRHDPRGYNGILSLICNIDYEIIIDMMKLLLQNGANSNIYRYNYDGSNYSPLDFLCWHNKNPEKIKLLVDYGAKIKFSNLISVVKHNNLNSVQILLDGGVDPYEKDKNGNDAFYYATSEEMKLLLSKNKFLNNWLNIMQQESDEGIIYSLKYRPENFHVWKHELEPTNSLLKYW